MPSFASVRPFLFLSAAAVLAVSASAGGCDGDVDNATAAPSSSNGSTGSATGGGGMTNASSAATGGMGGASVGGMGGGGSPPLGDLLVFYGGDYDTNDDHDVGRYNLSTNTPETLQLEESTYDAVNSMATPCTDIDAVAVSPNRQQLAVSCEPIGAINNGDVVLYVYNSDGTGAPIKVFEATGGDVDINELKFSPDGTTLAFLSDFELTNNFFGAFHVYVVPIMANATPKRVSDAAAPTDTALDVLEFAWARNSTHIAVRGDLITNDVVGLWTVDTTAATPAPVEVVPQNLLDTTQNLHIGLGFDSTNRLYFRGDYELANDQFRLYRVDLDGQNLEQVPGTDLMNANGEASVDVFKLNDAGTRIAFAADGENADFADVYVQDVTTNTPGLVTALGAMAPLPNTRSAPTPFAGMAWSPDDSMLALSADWRIDGDELNNAFSLFVVPTDENNPGGQRLIKGSVTNGDAKQTAFTPDSSTLIMRGDLVVNNQDELYILTDLATDLQDPATVSLEDAPTGGDIDDDFVVTSAP